MKIKPLEDWLGDDPATSYVAIRADEQNRKGYVSTKPNISAVFPFIEEDVDHAGVLRILDEAGVGLPEYYEWRTRSGCYFCFYQRKAEWVGLAERHPDLFERAVAIEQKVLKDAGAGGDASYEEQAMQGRLYTWSQGETLVELLQSQGLNHGQARDRSRPGGTSRRNIPLIEVLAEALDEDDDTAACTVCTL